jgi:hypothetical protein
MRRDNVDTCQDNGIMIAKLGRYFCFYLSKYRYHVEFICVKCIAVYGLEGLLFLYATRAQIKAAIGACCIVCKLCTAILTLILKHLADALMNLIYCL